MTARIGRRQPDKTPLPPSYWRAHLRHLAKWMLIALALTLTAAAALLTRWLP
jgi:hypothetical protein